MCRNVLTNYRCGHRFAATREPCFYETHRHESQPRCRFTTVRYSRWDENGETHCEDCRKEIRKARPRRVLAAKIEQLKTYELGIAEHTRDIDEHEEEFQRLEAEDDFSLVESSSQSGEKTLNSERATPLTGVTSVEELISPKADVLPYSPSEDETFETELSSYEMELLKFREGSLWTERIEGELKKEESELSGTSLKVEPASEVEKPDVPSIEPLNQRIQEMRMINDAKENAERRSREEKFAELRSLFAEAREQADKLDRSKKLTRLQSLFAEARTKAALLEEK